MHAQTCPTYRLVSHSVRLSVAGSDEINDLAQLLDCVADILWCTCVALAAVPVSFLILFLSYASILAPGQPQLRTSQ
jgi:hypothetical protein